MSDILLVSLGIIETYKKAKNYGCREKLTCQRRFDDPDVFARVDSKACGDQAGQKTAMLGRTWWRAHNCLLPEVSFVQLAASTSSFNP
jgi:hypothetical protein